MSRWAPTHKKWPKIMMAFAAAMFVVGPDGIARSAQRNPANVYWKPRQVSEHLTEAFSDPYTLGGPSAAAGSIALADIFMIVSQPGIMLPAAILEVIKEAPSGPIGLSNG